MFEKRRYGAWDIVPGLLTWGTLLGALILSFIRPLWVIYFVIVFDLYWLMRVSYFAFYLVVSWKQYRKDTHINWQEKLTKLPNWQEYYHIIFFPVASEGYEVIKTTFDSLLAAKYPKDKMIVVLGFEEGRKFNYDANATRIQAEYGDKFYKLVITLHPVGLPGEIVGKGSNANWMGHAAKKKVDEWQIPYDKLIVSYFDVDTVTHEQYFAYLSYKFLTHPNPYRTSFQPVALFNNNIWYSNFVTRVTSFGCTFWLLTELARPERLFTFSSHSMSWQALVDVDFWEKDIVTDDSRIFLQCFFRYDGDYNVAPLYMPVSMDTVDADTTWQSLKNLYKQQRRWAWGIEHFPYMMGHFRLAKKGAIPWQKKWKYLFNITEGMWSWATTPILIFILGRLPLWVIAGQDVAKDAVVQNSPFVLEWLMRFAMIGIFCCVTVSLLLLPPRPQTRPRYQWLVMICQWFFLPITLVCWGSIGAIEAQTRLMLGKYLGFFNTPKPRKV